VIFYVRFCDKLSAAAAAAVNGTDNDDDDDGDYKLFDRRLAHQSSGIIRNTTVTGH